MDLAAFAEAEYDYLRSRSGRDFFLALSRYAMVLRSKRRVRRIISKVEGEMRQTLEAFVVEQDGLIEDARGIRQDLAARAPEIDNSDMAEPPHAASDRWRYDLDSFANFDRIAEGNHAIGYPIVPKDDDDPGPTSRLIQILRGRFRAAEYGEDAGINDPQVREDLDDLGTRIGNLGERHRESVQRYRLHSRTLAGTAWLRLVYFGSGLVAEAVQIERAEDIEQFLDRSLREWLQPKTTVRKLVNGERLDDGERRVAEEIEAFLKEEASRLHREVMARLTTGHRSFFTLVREEPLAVAIVGGSIAAIVSGLILALVLR